MNMRQNLGTVDRTLRFALAFWWLGPWPLRFAAEWVNWLIIAVAWIALAESFLGYCWLHEMLGIGKRG
ncbi:TPA: DUF2892 domain-containing protein [Candidatus Woesearchaeota archaeon]|nr:DUF2892 domain-containing protein [Candidatus Woesearchaeota archaeon]